MVLWLAAVALTAGLAFVPARAGASDTASFSATRTLTLLPSTSFSAADAWLRDGNGAGATWVGVARAQVSKYAANGSTCAPTGYLSLRVLSPPRTAYSLGAVFASVNGDSLLPTPLALDGSGTADLSTIRAEAHPSLPEFLVVLGGSGKAPASVDVQLAWTGVASPECSTAAAPASLKVIKHVVGGTATAGEWSLHVKDGSGADVGGSPQAGSETGTTYMLPAGTFTVSEAGEMSGYTRSFSGDCDAAGAVTLAAGEAKTCTVTNTAAPPAPTLTVIKHVVGGGASAGRWVLHVKDASGAEVGAAAGSEAGTTYTLSPGAFTVSESGDISGYTGTFSGDCTADGVVTLAAGDRKTCTLTNMFGTTAPPTLTVIKHVVGGGATAGQWSLHVQDATGKDVAGSPQAGSESGTTYALSSGTFAVSETGGVSGYTGTFSGDCTADGVVTLAAGDRKVCTLTNSFGTLPPPTLTVIKHVVGGGATAGQWSLHVLDAAGKDVTGSPQAGSEFGTTYAVSSGTFTVFETGDTAGYTASFSGDCDATGAVTLAAGDKKTCTLTNTAVTTTSTLTVRKIVSGGTAAPADWQIHVRAVGAGDVSGSPQPGSAAGTGYGLAPGSYTVTESDGPAGYSLTYSGDCDATGAVSLAAGASKTCTLTNTYRDSTPPVLHGPGNLTPTATSAAGAAVSYEVTATDPDDAAVTVDCVSSPGGLGSGATFPFGVTAIHCTATDAAGNAATPLDFTVTVVDAAPLVNVPSNIRTATTDPGGKAVAFDVSATDYLDGSLPVSCDHATGSVFPVGTTTVLCSATNSSKLTTIASFTVTVDLIGDLTAPTITSPGDQATTATSAAGAVVSFNATASDPDDAPGTLTVVCDPASGSTFAIATTTVTCQAHDPAGNNARPVSFTVTVADAAPIVKVPPNIDDTTNDPKGKAETFSVSATDYLDGSLPVSCDHASGSVFPVGATTVLCSATNSSKLTTVESFTVTVDLIGDLTAPTIVSPGDQAATASSKDGTKVPFRVTATDPDNTPAELTVTCDHASGDTFPLGPTTVTCNAYDPAGNAAAPVSFTVTVTYLDTTAPTLHSPGDQTAVASSKDGAAVSFSVTADDPDDAPGTLTVSCDPQSGATFPIGATNVTCNAQDPAGNKAKPLSLTVTVGDAPPVLHVPDGISDVTRAPQGKAVTFEASASDFGDGSDPVTCDHSAGETFPVGTTTVLCSATNSSKQTTVGSFTVTIRYDDTAPTIQVPDNRHVTASSAAGATVAYAVSATDSDDAASAMALDCGPLKSGSLFPVGVTTITCGASDPAGNHATPASFTVTVDPPPPAPVIAPTVSVSVSSPLVGRVGDDISFTVVVKSSGGAPATGVEVKTQVPDDATLISTAGPATCSGSPSVVCVFGTVTSGTSQTQTIVLRAQRAGSLSLFAVVSGDGAAGSSSASTTVLDQAAPPPAPPAPTQPQTFNAISTETVLENGKPVPSNTLFLIVSGDRITLRGLLAITTSAGNSGLFSNLPFPNLTGDGPPTVFTVTTIGGRTILTLEGGDFSVCTAPRRTSASDPKQVVRQLWGQAKGSFTTKAKYSSATIRGTTWGVQDRCDGTFTTAVDDFVDVVDFSLNKTLTLSPGQTYLAKPPRKLTGSFRPPSQNAATIRANGLVWAGRRFRTKSQLSAWLSSRGSSWKAFAQAHPALAQALASRRA